MMSLTAKEVDAHFDAAKKICKALLPSSDRAKLRILRYFMDLVEEEGDMDKERNILMNVAAQLGIKID
jgi:hypothetical protein